MGAGYCTPHQTEKVIFCLFLLHIFSSFLYSFLGLHRLWLWSLCWRHCLHWLLNQFEPVQISNKESFHIFSDSKYAKRLKIAVSNEYLYLLTTSSCVNRVGDFVKPEPFENEIKENRKSLTFRSTLSLHLNIKKVSCDPAFVSHVFVYSCPAPLPWSVVTPRK